MPRSGTPILRKDSRCVLPTNPKPINAAVCFSGSTPGSSSTSIFRSSAQVERYQFSGSPQPEFSKSRNLELQPFGCPRRNKTPPSRMLQRLLIEILLNRGRNLRSPILIGWAKVETQKRPRQAAGREEVERRELIFLRKKRGA